MIRHSGACVLFSVLILVMAAMVLYRSEPTPALAEEVVPSVEAVSETPPEPAIVEAEPSPVEAELPPVETPARVEAEPGGLPVESGSDPVEVRRPEAPFTLSEPGETMLDVARRVYGTVKVAPALRQVNRDLIDRDDEPIKPGSALRTPPLDREESFESASWFLDEAP
ncbi:MAG TPA: hypothetical protein VFT74_09245 [Isosphaeraceae bacterium]|nr:hypothetical protein [Isosphaeraceae bacterium]